ncbi:MAG: HD-GYP domain-containing protein [Anaerovoracaceae bacterium]
MSDIKLQLGCLVIILYITFVYIRSSLRSGLSCSHYFDVLLVICPWAVFFDGLTAWTVNHRALVPDELNLVFHALFFLLMDAVIIGSFLYMLDVTGGLPKKKSGLFALLIPGILSFVCIILFLPEVHYIHGVSTDYSMGISVYACFTSMLIHFGLVFGITFVRRRNLKRRKLFSIFFFEIVAFVLLISQILFPEILMTSLFPAILIVGLYINLEDPSYRILAEKNAATVVSFATLVENRDHSTGGHIHRTQGYVSILLQEMQREPKYRRLLTLDYTDYIKRAAPMHDIGKISTPDRILQKPGKLTDEEYEIMKLHAPRGGEIILQTFANLNEPEFQKIAYEVARHHHEKWNGTGYPDGLKGEAIPLHARIMAIADVFDAVSADRCYRDALPLDTCFQIIREGSGRDFDPTLTALFLRAKDRIVELHLQDRG